MTIKRYQKFNLYEDQRKKPRTGLEYLIYLLSSILLTGGFVLLSYRFLFPLLSLASRSSYLRPVSNEYLSQLVSQRESFVFKELESRRMKVSGIFSPEFYLSLPQIGIERAVVKTNSPSLAPDKSLGHLTGSSLPGTKGLTVIYGHSASPILYEEGDYQKIFSKLDKLQEGDKLQVEYSGVDYTYVVRSSEIVSPGEMDFNHYLSTRGALALITCYPSGSVEKRLVVYAALVY